MPRLIVLLIVTVALLMPTLSPARADYFPPPPACAERLGDAYLVAKTIIVPGHGLFSKLICVYSRVATVNDFPAFCGLASIYDPLLKVKVKAKRVKCVYRVLPRYLVP